MYSRLIRNWEVRLAQHFGQGHRPLPYRVGGHWFRDEFPDIIRADDDLEDMLELTDRLCRNATDFYQPVIDQEIPIEQTHGLIRFRSRGVTNEESNRTVYLAYRPAAPGCPMVVAVPPWNTERWKLKQLLPTVRQSDFGGAAISLPYQDERMPKGWTYAQALIGPDLGLTLRAIQQSVLDTMDAVTVLQQLGHERIVLLGFSIGSAIINLLDAHDPRKMGIICTLCGDSFAECVWHGISTRHIRKSLDGRIDFDLLDRIWGPISARTFVHLLPGHGRTIRSMLTCQYDYTFPSETGRRLRRLFEDHQVPHTWMEMPCGHYTLSYAPFSLRFLLWLRSSLRQAALWGCQPLNADPVAVEPGGTDGIAQLQGEVSFGPVRM